MAQSLASHHRVCGEKNGAGWGSLRVLRFSVFILTGTLNRRTIGKSLGTMQRK